MRIVSCFETADPLLNWTRRIRLDAFLLLLFFVVMYDRLTQNPLHEALGTASLLIVCAHLLVNRTWLRQHFGAWFGTAVRHPRRPLVKNRISTISNVVLLATFAARCDVLANSVCLRHATGLAHGSFLSNDPCVTFHVVLPGSSRSRRTARAACPG